MQEQIRPHNQTLNHHANSVVSLLWLQESHLCCTPYAEACHLLTVPSKDDPHRRNGACIHGCQTLSHYRMRKAGMSVSVGIMYAVCTYHRPVLCSTAHALSYRTYDRSRGWSGDVSVGSEVPICTNMQGYYMGCSGCCHGLDQHDSSQGHMPACGPMRQHVETDMI